MSAPVRLTRRLMLETPVRSDDGAGGFVETWMPLGQLWAEVTSRTGRQTDGGGTPRATVPYVITVRAAPEGAPSRPQAGQRFAEGSRIYGILAVADDDPGRRYLTCFAEEEVVS